MDTKDTRKLENLQDVNGENSELLENDDNLENELKELDELDDSDENNENSDNFTIVGIADMNNSVGFYTEKGLGLRFLDIYGQDYVFCQDAKFWMKYNSETKLWEYVSNENVLYAVSSIADFLRRDEGRVVQTADEQTVKALRSFIKSCETSYFVNGALKFIKGRNYVDLEKFDSQTQYLAMKNGNVYDLENQQVLEGDRKFLLTKHTNGNVKDSVSQIFLDFLHKIFKNQEDLDYVQLYLGSALVGRKLRGSNDKTMMFFDGVSGTGKTTFLKVVGEALGDYYKEPKINILTDKIKDGDKPTPMLSDLANGVRLVGVSEAPEGCIFEDANFKKYSGGDLLCTRKMYSDLFYFRPDWKMLLVSNFIPYPRNVNDDAFRKRFRRLRFDSAIENPDEDINKKIYNQDFLDDAITWMAQGSKKYLERNKQFDDYDGHNANNCNLPKSMIAAMKDYFDENDDSGDFFRTFFEYSGNEQDYLPWKHIYDVWKDYSGDRNTTLRIFIKQCRNGFVKTYKLKEEQKKLSDPDTGKKINPMCLLGIREITAKGIMKQKVKKEFELAM